ncbi:MAG TPA: hypothetical protein VI029_14990 [Mycobacterium sp.]
MRARKHVGISVGRRLPRASSCARALACARNGAVELAANNKSSTPAAMWDTGAPVPFQ